MACYRLVLSVFIALLLIRCGGSESTQNSSQRQPIQFSVTASGSMQFKGDEARISSHECLTPGNLSISVFDWTKPPTQADSLEGTGRRLLLTVSGAVPSTNKIYRLKGNSPESQSAGGKFDNNELSLSLGLFDVSPGFSSSGFGDPPPSQYPVAGAVRFLQFNNTTGSSVVELALTFNDRSRLYAKVSGEGELEEREPFHGDQVCEMSVKHGYIKGGIADACWVGSGYSCADVYIVDPERDKFLNDCSNAGMQTVDCECGSKMCAGNPYR